MNRTVSSGLTALLVVVGAAAAAQPPAGSSGVHDRAKMFSPEAAAKAERILREAERDGPGHWQTVIETRESTDGRPPAEVAAAGAKAAGVRGLYVLITRADRRVQIEPSGSAAAIYTKPERERVFDAITQAFRQRKFDDGLLAAAAEARRAALGFGVRDDAKMFTAEAVAKANDALDRLRTRSGKQVVVETVDLLDGKTPAEAAAARARALKLRGLYVLVAFKEHKTFVEPSGSEETTFTPERTRAINDALARAFKAQEFDRGLTDAVALIDRDAGAGAGPKALAGGPTAAKAFGLAPAKPEASEVPDQTPKPRLAGPGDSEKPRAAVPTPPPAPSPEPSLAPASDKPARPLPPRRNPTEPSAGPSGSVLPMVLIVVGVVIGLWILSRAFRRAPAPAPAQPRPDAMNAPAPGYGYGQPAGYGPAQAPPPPQQGGPGRYPPAGPRPGYGGPPPPQAPGYGPPPQAPGYGYPPPAAPAGGGGFVTGALGGLGGAIVGNILYDKFGRPHEAPPAMPHTQGGVAPTPGAPWPGAGAGAGAGAAGPPPETYDPNAGTGGDWGAAPIPAQDQPAPEAVGGEWASDSAETAPGSEAVGGDWGAPEPEAGADAGTGGDWGSAPAEAEPEAEPDPDADTGADWSAGNDEPAADAGADWSGNDDAGSDGGGGGGGGDDQGGSW